DVGRKQCRASYTACHCYRDWLDHDQLRRYPRHLAVRASLAPAILPKGHHHDAHLFHPPHRLHWPADDVPLVAKQEEGCNTANNVTGTGRAWTWRQVGVVHLQPVIS